MLEIVGILVILIMAVVMFGMIGCVGLFILLSFFSLMIGYIYNRFQVKLNRRESIQNSWSKYKEKLAGLIKDFYN